MARPIKNTVDYFPHVCHHGQTMFIIESNFGNDGYVFWFKLLEKLGAAENHFIDCRSVDVWEYLVATVRLSEDRCIEILNKLAKLGAIDAELWDKKIVFSENFVENIASAYDKRKTLLPTKTKLLMTLCGVSATETTSNSDNDDVSGGKKPQSKLKKNKVNNIYTQKFSDFYSLYPRKVAKQDAEKAWSKIDFEKVSFDEIIAGLKKAIASEGWIKDNGKYIPYPATWLNGQRWQDEYAEDLQQPSVIIGDDTFNDNDYII